MQNTGIQVRLSDRAFAGRFQWRKHEETCQSDLLSRFKIFQVGWMYGICCGSESAYLRGSGMRSYDTNIRTSIAVVCWHK